MVSYLRPINCPDAHHSAAVLSLLVKGLRAHWPEVNIVFRGDRGFYRPLLLNWCERHGIRYIVGYRTNEVLMRECQVSREAISSAWQLFEYQDLDIPSLKVFLDIDTKPIPGLAPVE